VILSCVDVPRANCVPILSLPVRLFLFNCRISLALTFLTWEILSGTLGGSSPGRFIQLQTSDRARSSPPRGRFSHLAMFRLGTFLFIPGYITITLYRVFASADSGGTLLLMIRECHLRWLNCTAHKIPQKPWQSARKCVSFPSSRHGLKLDSLIV
jgi:hypothetical protein